MNVSPEMDCSAVNNENSNTPPFPFSRLIESNVLVPLSVSFPVGKSISGLLDVVMDTLDVNVIPSNSRVPEDTSINEHSSLTVLFTSIVNDLNVALPVDALTVKGVPDAASVEETSNVTLSYGSLLSVG